MARLRVLLAVLLLFASANAQLNVTEVLKILPKCALNCIVAHIGNSSCTITDANCFCHDDRLQSQLSDCVQGACSYADQLTASTINVQLCAGQVLESRRKEVTVSGIVFAATSIPVVILRCYSRHSIARKLWWDDWTIVAAAVFLVGIVAIDIINSNNGFGTHIWDIDLRKAQSLLKLFLIGEIFYIFTLALTKISIVLFYLRVFRASTFRLLCWATIGFIILWALPFILLIIFQCKPIDAAWDRSVTGKCLSVNALAFSSAGISIAQDVLVLGLPITQLVGLQMSLRKKLNVLAMFSIGAVATVTSILRLRFIVSFGSSKDPTWDNVSPSLWSLIEMNVAMVCACLPALRALFSRWLPSMFDISNHHRSGNTSHVTGQNSASGKWESSRVANNRDKYARKWKNKRETRDIDDDEEEEEEEGVFEMGGRDSKRNHNQTGDNHTVDVQEVHTSITTRTPSPVPERFDARSSQEDLWISDAPDKSKEGTGKKAHVVLQLSSGKGKGNRRGE